MPSAAGTAREQRKVSIAPGRPLTSCGRRAVCVGRQIPTDSAATERMAAVTGSAFMQGTAMFFSWWPACASTPVGPVMAGAVRAGQAVTDRLTAMRFAIPPACKAASAEHSGGGGIRTHGPLRVSGFQDRRNRPLCHPSMLPARILNNLNTASTNHKRSGQSSAPAADAAHASSAAGDPAAVTRPSDRRHHAPGERGRPGVNGAGTTRRWRVDVALTRACSQSERQRESSQGAKREASKSVVIHADESRAQTSVHVPRVAERVSRSSRRNQRPGAGDAWTRPEFTKFLAGTGGDGVCIIALAQDGNGGRARTGKQRPDDLRPPEQPHL